MSLAPHVLPKSRIGQKIGDWAMKDSMINDGLWDVFNNYHMGVTAENVAKQYGITREEQDKFAAASQQKAEAAQKARQVRRRNHSRGNPAAQGQSRRLRQG